MTKVDKLISQSVVVVVESLLAFYPDDLSSNLHEFYRCLSKISIRLGGLMVSLIAF